jgi:hypothetical protein
MLLLAAAAAIAPMPATGHPVSASVQATATIRVVQGVTLKLDGSANADAPTARNAVVRSSDGTTEQMKLIEFQ